MGVYIELYAPIFNYNSMSQVIKKFEPGGKTTQPRLYKRGNDDIDLDAYIRNAESEFSYWLANSRLKDKEKQQVQEAYSQMIQGINDGTFTYKIGGGYNNSVGMSNETKGFDAAGLAAGFLGNILRNQSVYKAPEEKPDPSKIEWKGNSSVGSALVKHLYGSDRESLKDFIDLDPYDTKTKKRGNANRSARFKSGLEYIRDNFDNLFTSFTDSDKATALEGINSALSAFNNGTVEDNEYLDLGRATGMSNLRDMFFSGETYGSTPQTPGTPGTPGGGGTDGGVFTNEDEWRSAKYPRLNTQVVAPVHLTDPNKYGNHSRIQLDKHLRTLSKNDLLDIVRSITVPNLYNHPKLRDKAASWSHVPFSNKYIALNALKVLKDKGYLNGYADSSGNNFYIDGSYNKRRGTGLVWNMGNMTISETNIYDIPWWITKMHNEFTAQVPSNKKGGILKFQAGGTPQWYAGLTDYDPTKYTFAYNVNNLVDGDMSDASFDPWASSTAGKQLGRYTPTTGHGAMGVNKAHFNFAKGVEGQQYYQDFGKALVNEDGTPTDVGVAWMKKVDALLPEDSPARFYDASGNLRTSWSPTGKDAHERTQTSYTSLADYISAIRNDQILGARHNVFLNEGNRYFYKDVDGAEHWVDPEQVANYTVSENPIRSQWNDDNTVYWNDYELTGLKALEEATGDDPQGGQPEHSDAWNKVFGVGKDQVNEKFLPPVNTTPKTGSFGNFMAGLAPDLIGAGRLWASLHTNNRVYDTVLPSLKPVLKDTYERYSPVTGAFSARQFKSRQGADVMRQSNQPFTSDASLASARMLEGQRQANQLQAEGFLADDQEIRRTQAEALARQEDNMARRSEVANFNRASINQTNRERAQLGATRLKSNWQSWDNFLQGFESRIRTRMDENRERANNFYDKLSANQAEEWYNTAMEPADRAYAAWQKANVGADPSTEWGENGSEWQNYVKHKREARARANSMIYQSMANRYGLHYTNPYTEESNALFNWNRRYV